MGAFSSLVAAGLTTLAIGKATRALVDDTRVQFQGEQVHPSCRTPPLPYCCPYTCPYCTPPVPDPRDSEGGARVSSTPDPLLQLLPMR